MGTHVEFSWSDIETGSDGRRTDDIVGNPGSAVDIGPGTGIAAGWDLERCESVEDVISAVKSMRNVLD